MTPEEFIEWMAQERVVWYGPRPGIGRRECRWCHGRIDHGPFDDDPFDDDPVVPEQIEHQTDCPTILAQQVRV
jgi:hypothetical protein